MNALESMRVEELNINRIGRFESFDLTFNRRLTIISGGNGVGKSTILQLIAQTFSVGHSTRNISRNASFREGGEWSVQIKLHGNSERATLQVSNDPSMPVGFSTHLSAVNRLLIFLGASRNFEYQDLGAIGRDPGRGNHEISMQYVSGLQPTDMKRWLANRILFQGTNSLSSDQTRNLDLAKSFFSLLDKNVVFASIDPTNFNVIVNTSAGKIPYEVLSSGFRSSLALLIGLVNEIEIRGFSGLASDFAGVILIDEVDLHLHPSWQCVIATALTTAFPHAQFIMTTHSPHVIQNAEGDEVVALRINRDGGIYLADLPVSRRGYKGWSIEEILVDVMGLNDAVSKSYRDAVKNFEDALEMENSPKIFVALETLDELLHPRSEMRKLFRIQAAPYLESSND